MESNVFPKNHITHFLNSSEKRLIAVTVSGFPHQKKNNRMTVEVEVDTIFIGDSSFRTCGRALMNIRDLDIKPEYGDKMQIFARLQEPTGERNPGEFNYKKYLTAHRIYGIINIYKERDLITLNSGQRNSFGKTIFLFKTTLNNIINRLYYDQQRALMKGLILGERGEITDEVKESFVKSGVIHALAISGLHVGYIIVIFFAIFGFLRIPNRTKIILVIVSLLFYNLLIGFKPPIFRASLMATIFLFGGLLQRPADILNILSAAAFLILIINPMELFQASFQLSFAAILSIVYIYQKLKNIFDKNRFFRKLSQHKIGEYIVALFFVSLAAQLGTLPITAFYFNRISIISMLANLLVIPLVGLVIAYGFVSLIFSFISIQVAGLFANTNSLCLQALIFLTEKASSLKFSSYEIGSVGLLFVFLYYFGLFLLLNLDKPKIRKLTVVMILIVANVVIWKPVFQSNKWMEVIFFDVGQGDAALVKFPDGKNMLIDAGPNLVGFDAGLYFLLPYFKRNGINRINTVVLSHADNDHIGGMPILFRNIKIDQLFDTGLYHSSQVCSTYRFLIDSLQMDHHIVNHVSQLNNYKNYGVYLLHPNMEFWKKYKHDVNNSSVIVKVIYGKRSFLFTGDVEKEAEDVLVNYENLLKADVLKIPHHGSKTSSTLELLKLVNPKYAIISLGKNNKFKFPSPSVIQRLSDLNIPFIRTDKNGSVVFRTDGEKLERLR
ncbi:DNA internalization-related competence protein ComEC/Rec2 [candidate division KSB1 bacterium]|nr:DNA internalization-related competence protein ComEC/Rec2 [candidate division KSB1 bacterium]